MSHDVHDISILDSKSILGWRGALSAQRVGNHRLGGTAGSPSSPLQALALPNPSNGGPQQRPDRSAQRSALRCAQGPERELLARSATGASRSLRLRPAPMVAFGDGLRRPSQTRPIPDRWPTAATYVPVPALWLIMVCPPRAEAR